MRTVLLALIRLYQYALSPDHSFWARRLGLRFCRFRPTCSMFARQAIERHGAIGGAAMVIARLIRCGPWSRPGFDLVPEKFSLCRHEPYQ